MKLAIVILAVLGVSVSSALPTHNIFARNLKDDLEDFKNLVPVDRIVEIVIQYLADDAEVQNGVAFLTSDAFKTLVLDVEAIPEYREILRILADGGLDVYALVDKIHGLLDLPAFQPRTLLRNVVRAGGFRGLVDEILAILPLEELKALYYEKLETSPDFANLIAHIASDEFQAAIEKVRANPTYQHMREAALAYGIDVSKLSTIIRSLLGLPPRPVLRIASRNLKDDLEDFKKLVPVDRIVEIVIQYLADDAEVQNGVAFLTSDAFKTLVLDVEAIPEYRDILRILSEGGLDVYALVDKIHGLLDLPAFQPRVHFRNLVRAGGFRGLVDEILAVLPLEELKALYYEKLETSADFANLIAHIASDEFQAAIEKVRAHPTYQHMREAALAYGIDVSKLSTIIRSLLGLPPRPVLRIASRTLKDDFEDFKKLVPVDKIVEVVIVYLAEDAQVQSGVAYLTSDDFKQLVLDVEELPQYHEILRILADGGLDVYGLVDKIHGLLDLPAFKPRMFLRNARATGGFRGLVDEILALLPREQLRALYFEKLETSPEFANLIAHIVSDEFQAAVHQVIAHPTYQYIREVALSYGLDINGLGKFLKALLGLN
ncbi:uncharacterized protein LOC105691040 [Athalia rosae]|uniref:uncharacterized protein LOC105691040 n=1 Tax=Athalia rosae TaxID=37344 RepID=UPI002033916A|nr:uncharacterized protein LOC105691040 [Athalia rosae]